MLLQLTILVLASSSLTLHALPSNKLNEPAKISEEFQKALNSIPADKLPAFKDNKYLGR
jgi:hypothetical protein